MSKSESDSPGTVVVKSGGQSVTSIPQSDIAPGLSGSDDSMSSSLHWFPWYPNRWLGSLSVKCMTLAERGAYRELLDWQWQGQGYLPADVSTLSAVCGYDLSQYPAVLSKFPKVDNDRRANKVLLALWQDQQCKHSRRMVSAKSRWSKTQTQNKNKIKDTDTDTEGNAHALHDALHSALHDALHSSDCNSTLLNQDAPCPPTCRTDHAHHWPLDLVLKTAEHPTVAVPADHARSFFDHFAAVGWVDGSHRRISDLAARLRKWGRDQASHGKTYTQDTANQQDEAAWRAAKNAVAEAVWAAKESGADGEELRRVIRVQRDKYRDTPKLAGKDAVTCGVDYAMNNKRSRGDRE